MIECLVNVKKYFTTLSSLYYNKINNLLSKIINNYYTNKISHDLRLGQIAK